MDVFQQLRLQSNTLTPTERRIYDSIMNDPESILQSTTTMAAQHIGVSQSAISRFCQKVGYESFSDFRTSLLLSLSNNTPKYNDKKKDDSVEYLCEMLHATNSALSRNRVNKLCDMILAAHTVYTTGGGLSSPPALMLSMELLKYNIPCYFMHSGQEMIYMHVANASDLVIIFSSKNDTQRMLLNVLKEKSKKKRPFVIMVSHSPVHPLKKLVNEFIVLPTWQTERYPVYIEPMTSMLAFCSILMITVSQKIGRDPEMLPPIVNGKTQSKIK